MATTYIELAPSPGGVAQIQLGIFDFAVQGGVIGAYAISPVIPAKALIKRVDYEVITTFTSATDGATIALKIEGANDIKTAIAISNGANPWDAGVPLVTSITGATATWVKTTVERQVTLTSAVEALTAGRLRVYVEYVMSE